MTYKTIKEELETMYKSLCCAFSIDGRGWDMIHLRYSPYAFCKENRLALIGEYLVWQKFVENAKKYDIPYYIGIDTFLAEYKDAVLGRVNLD